MELLCIHFYYSINISPRCGKELFLKIIKIGLRFCIFTFLNFCFMNSDNPFSDTFDPSYVYASNQGIRAFAGIRYTLF